MKKTKKPQLGIALGEGGARGLAHIGVLQVLEEQGYRPQHVAGTSIGAVIGAMYAETLDPFLIQERFQALVEGEEYQKTGLSRLYTFERQETTFWDQISSKIKGTLALNLAQTRKGLLNTSRLEAILEQLIRIRDFGQCRIPFIAVATDLYWGREIPMCTGNLLRAVTASSCIPGFFPPMSHNGLYLSDGAICCPVPVRYALYQEDAITAAVAVPTRMERGRDPGNALDVMIRAEEVNMHYFTNSLMQFADVAMFPETGDVAWHEIHRVKDMVQAGRQAAEEAMPRLERIYRDRGRWFSLPRLW